VVTTAIAAGTALVGAFKIGAQIWQREGIRVEATNSNEDDFNFNRVSLRVEERLALDGVSSVRILHGHKIA
jgi:hypothetical protein